MSDGVWARPRSVFQMMSGFSLSRMAPELQFAVDHEMLAAQDVERLVGGADIGRGFLDDAAQLFEAPRRLGADFAHLAVDRHAAIVVGGERDAPRSGGPGQAVAEGYGRRIEGHGIVRAKARHRVEKQRQIGHIARHWPLHRERAPQIADGAARHAARRRPQPDDRAMAARAAQRAAMVGALREPDLAGRHRHRAAAGRAARGQRGVPGIARPAEHLVEGAAAGAEFRRVRLAHDDAALALDAQDQRVRFRRHVVGEERRAVGRAHARDIGEVLDRDRQAGEPAGLARGFAGRAALHDTLGMVAGAVEAEGRQRVYRRLDLADAPGGGFDQLERRDLAFPQPRYGLDRGHPPESE